MIPAMSGILMTPPAVLKSSLTCVPSRKRTTVVLTGTGVVVVPTSKIGAFDGFAIELLKFVTFSPTGPEKLRPELVEGSRPKKTGGFGGVAMIVTEVAGPT